MPFRSRVEGFLVSDLLPVISDKIVGVCQIFFGFTCGVFISGPFDLIRDIFSSFVAQDPFDFVFFLIIYDVRRRMGIVWSVDCVLFVRH